MARELSVTVSSKGQIAIPKTVRQQIGLRQGSRLSLSVQGQILILRRPGLLDWRQWKGRLKGSRIDKDLEQDHRQEIAREKGRIRDA